MIEVAKKVFKYGTGEKVPENATYLCTRVQRKIKITNKASVGVDYDTWANCWLVWHYFLVEVEEE